MVRILLTGYSSRSSVIIGLNFQQIGKNPGFSSRPVIFRKNPGVSPTSRGNPAFAFGPEKFVGSRRLGYIYVFVYILWIWMDFKEQHFWHIILKFWACCSSWSNSSSDLSIATDLLQVSSSKTHLQPFVLPTSSTALSRQSLKTRAPYQPWLLEYWEHSSYQRSNMGSGC